MTELREKIAELKSAECPSNCKYSETSECEEYKFTEMLLCPLEIDQILSLIAERVRGIENPYNPNHELLHTAEYYRVEYRNEGFEKFRQALLADLEVSDARVTDTAQ